MPFSKRYLICSSFNTLYMQVSRFTFMCGFSFIFYFTLYSLMLRRKPIAVLTDCSTLFSKSSVTSSFPSMSTSSKKEVSPPELASELLRLSTFNLVLMFCLQRGHSGYFLSQSVMQASQKACMHGKTTSIRAKRQTAQSFSSLSIDF